MTQAAVCITAVQVCIIATASCVMQTVGCITAAELRMMQHGVAVTHPQAGVMQEPFPVAQEGPVALQTQRCDTQEHRLVTHHPS